MFKTVELPEARPVWEPPPVKPLDEALWQAWVMRSLAEERRGNAARTRAAKWISIATLLGTVVLWPLPASYGVGVRFLVAAGAIAVMFQAFHLRYYAIAAVFGALALLYNPVAPVFSFSGGWQHALVATSAVPFLLSLDWPSAGETHNG